ncbi:BREX-6 system adenine-specific DNA-methyltransferase PglX [Azospirillum sp. Sh1]|uniref:BREX-6 system adenine-specific DNA-methyltransferase PglX n=1 Tax=Azospirillum sp. Sh1 TaxID=2607285 RepID=UPI0011ED8D5C|nr:BREX-6 system adenine-specific DNA-methyltransferase PglX [Azospirillum sp. Sh1]KAA0574316.1 BREX-6 system adenine-specific DNA-methyltransferase PglX [Azospirillum sp. Sh1]
MPLTPDAKSKLSATIRGLRAYLLQALEDNAAAVYRLAVTADKAGLGEAEAVRRGRLEAWLDERARASGAKTRADLDKARPRFLEDAVKEAAATLLNRLVLLRLMEAMGLRKARIVTGGWNSRGYREFRGYAGPLLEDGSEGYATLLDLVFDDLAVDLPGLYGRVGLTDLIPVPVAALRRVVEELDKPELDSAWTDDTTLGWIYQYWNDPERERLDGKIKDGGKIEPHEIASKTQMFTERYMVEWLLQNSLGVTWLAMCRKQGWTPDAARIFPALEARRAEWRERRARGEVPLDALMPIDGELEEHWKYYVAQEIPEDAVTAAPESLRALKLLDPACGSGHFLVIACDLLFALYREEARHRGEAWTDADIVDWIVGNNLHGIDIDPRAVQIAAAALYLKARTLCRDARPRTLNLVAPAFNLAGLPDDDPALRRLIDELHRDTGLPEPLTLGLVRALAGADHLGTLLKVEDAVKEALLAHQLATGDREPTLDAWANGQVKDLTAFPPEDVILARLESFLAKHTAAADLGLRLDGEQLAAGVRFMRMVKPGTYHVVVANPPYLDTDNVNAPIKIKFSSTKAVSDLYSIFLNRSLTLLGSSGRAAMITKKEWLFGAACRELREEIVDEKTIFIVGDLQWRAFDEQVDIVVSLSILGNSQNSVETVALRPTDGGKRVRDALQVHRNIAGLICQHQVFSVKQNDLRRVPGKPLVYWWNEDDFAQFDEAMLVGQVSEVCQGISTGCDPRFIRSQWEICERASWVPCIKGPGDSLQLGNESAWIEPLRHLISWENNGLGIRTMGGAVLRNPDKFFKKGVAFTMRGTDFRARIHRYESICQNKGSSVYGGDPAEILCLLNSEKSKRILDSLNPGIGYEVGDIKRLPISLVSSSESILLKLDEAFTEHEAARENSVEFKRPGRSAWNWAQDWAQRAVDRAAGEPLPPWQPEHEEAKPVDHVSFAVGVALGRFGAGGEGILDAAPADALPHGILFLAPPPATDSLADPATAGLRAAWREHGGAVKPGAELRDWLRADFFKHHKALYENRPIWLPLSSAKKSFVAWVSIHRWADDTLDVLRADHLIPARTALQGELADVQAARARAEGKARATAEKRYDELRKWLDELDAFIAAVEQLAEHGAPPVDGCRARAADARFRMDLDDGVMVNAAALWPLLAPQWKDPAGWWKELSEAKGKKNYDWSHLAARYWPARVDEACRKDPSLAVAHGCFWKYHPARAYAWELRLQDELRPDFTIDEPGSREARDRFLAEEPKLAAEIREKERKRREKKSNSGAIFQMKD